jgi:hypothetical protein
MSGKYSSKAIKRQVLRLVKSGLNNVRRHQESKTVVLIVGCQRSGTTMLVNVFDNDLGTRVYDENSELTCNRTEGLRLKSLETVASALEKRKERLIVIKPLVESQNVRWLLNSLENSKAIWVYRHYRAVVVSNLQKFGIKNGLADLRPIAENRADDWRSEKVSTELRRTVSAFYSPNMDPHDAAALFWFARNSLFFELALPHDDRILLCRYEDFVTEPEIETRRIYSFLGVGVPDANITGGVHAGSVGRGRNVKLSDEVESLCRGLYERIEAAYQTSREKLPWRREKTLGDLQGQFRR